MKIKGFELKTKNGHPLDEVASGLQKAIRRGLEERAMYFTYELIEGGFINYFWRRMAIIVIEDIGLADPSAAILINSIAQLNERVNKKEYTEIFHPAMAVLYLCRASKSREVDYAIDLMETRRKKGLKIEPDSIDLDMHTSKGRQILREKGGDYQRLADEKFYYEGVLLNKPVSIEKDEYKKLVWRMRKLDQKRLYKKL